MDISYFSTQNNFHLRVTNLADKTRNKLRKDTLALQFSATDTNFRKVSLLAGYGNAMPLILKGNVVRGWSHRDGVNFVTELEGFDSGFAFANGVTATPFPAGTPRADIMQSLIQSLPEVSLGCVSNKVVQGTIPRGNSFDGNTCDQLASYTGGAFFIANGTVHVLGNDECTDDPVLIINSASGLLGTPIYEQANVHLDMVFEPRVKLGQNVVIESLTETRFNGSYKVISVHHRGTVSQTVAGDAVTSLGLVSGKFNPVARAIK